MIEHGEFSGECGDSIDRLIDNNRELEAIVCCCDLIAHSVYRVMGRRKLAVGQYRSREARLSLPRSEIKTTLFSFNPE